MNFRLCVGRYSASVSTIYLLYFLGVLDDFEGTDLDLFEAIGGILMEMNEETKEDAVHEICRQIHHTLELE